MPSEAYCVSKAKVEAALIEMLRKEHPGALTISVDWDIQSEKCAAMLWWSPSRGTSETLDPGADATTPSKEKSLDR